jgi:hypothetical protein
MCSSFHFHLPYRRRLWQWRFQLGKHAQVRDPLRSTVIDRSSRTTHDEPSIVQVIQPESTALATTNGTSIGTALHSQKVQHATTGSRLLTDFHPFPELPRPFFAVRIALENCLAEHEDNRDVCNPERIAAFYLASALEKIKQKSDTGADSTDHAAGMIKSDGRSTCPI